MKIARKLFVNGLIVSLLLSSATLARAETAETEGEVGFVNNTLLPPVVNPLEPGTEIETDMEGTAGPLSIDYVPQLDFGKNQISTADKTYYAALNTVTVKDGGTQMDVPNFVQVTDNRGNKAGWTLSVSASHFMTGEGEVLTGAYLTFHNANVYTPNARGDGPTALDPVRIAEVDTSYPVLTAAAGQGAATWGAYYGNAEDNGKNSVTLSVPGRSTKLAEKYTATLTWSLAETPY